MVLKNSVLNNSDNLLRVGHVVLSPLGLEFKRLIDPVFYHKRGQEKEQSSKGQTLFENYSFLPEEIYRNGHNGLLLCSDVQSFIRKPHLQVLCISKRQKGKGRVQTMDPSDKVCNNTYNYLFAQRTSYNLAMFCECAISSDSEC